MARIVFVRHAESEFNAAKLWQGQLDPPLSSSGERSSQLAAAHLRGFAGAIWTSPLKRAHATANAFCEILGLRAPRVIDDLREIDVGRFGGKTHEQIRAEMPDLAELHSQGKLTSFPYGESRVLFLRRVCAAIEIICNEHAAEEQVLVVTHGGVIASLERAAGVYPGSPIPHLSARWFDCPDLVAIDERIDLLSQALR